MMVPGNFAAVVELRADKEGCITSKSVPYIRNIFFLL